MKGLLKQPEKLICTNFTTDEKNISNTQSKLFNNYFMKINRFSENMDLL